MLISSRAEYLPYAPSAHPPDDVRRWVQERLLLSSQVTVVEHDGQIVGVLAVSDDGCVCWIDQLYLRPGWVRQGIGTLCFRRPTGDCAVRSDSIRFNRIRPGGAFTSNRATRQSRSLMGPRMRSVARTFSTS